jgi:membrane-bound ClpP family serine protease
MSAGQPSTVDLANRRDMDYVTLAFLLAFVGFALIITELFIPSGGMITILCIISFVVSIWLAYRGWWRTSPGYFWTYVSGLIAIIPIFVVGVFRVLENTQLGDRILLTAPSLEEVTPHRDEQQYLTSLVGRQGKALSMLNPGGFIRVDEERLHAFTEGVVIDPDEPVEIIEVRGSRVLVRRSETAPPQPAATTDESGSHSTIVESSSTVPSAPAPLDFDMPQG